MMAFENENTHSSDPPQSQEREIVSTSRSNLSLEIAGAAVFGALSIALASIASYIPRIPGWYIAWFDPISIVWILSFLIFGIRTGLLTTIIGTIGLIPFDPTVWIGPVMKFLSTIWFIIIPYLWVKMHTLTLTHQEMKKVDNFLPSVLIAWVIRCAVMVGLNYLILRYVFFDTVSWNLSWVGLGNISGIWAIVITVLFINTLQSVVDAGIPYFLVFYTPIEEALTIY